MNVISNLRSRPASERWILAVAAYAAIAAVVIALWVVSFRDNIARISGVTGESQASPDSSALPPLLSPFETLSQTSRQARERFAEVLAGAERIGRGGEESKTAYPESENAALPGALSSEAEITVRYATGEDTAAPTEALPAAGRLGEGGVAFGSSIDTSPTSPTARPDPVAAWVAGRLAAADLSGEIPRTIEDPLTRRNNRLGFFSALASVLSAIAHSFAGLVQ